MIQVLGELSNDNAPSQKFAQTFFLAMSQSPVGYYVLNNIFRFLKEDVDSDFDDDVEPDSATEIDTAISHNNPLSSDALANGFHPSSRSTASEEEVSRPPSLPTSSVPTPLSPETRLESEDLPGLPSPAVEFPEDTASQPTSESSAMPSAVPLESSQVGASSTERDPSIPHQGPSLRSQPEYGGRQVETSVSGAATASTPVVKTWATMAASKPEKIQGEPKAGGPTSFQKGNSTQVLTRQEATKAPSQRGGLWSSLTLIVQ